MRISSACSSRCATGSVSTPSLSAARAIAVASIGSDFPGSRTARRDVSVSPGATRTTRSPLASSPALQPTGYVPAVLYRPHALGVELCGEPQRLKRAVVRRRDRQPPARDASYRIERDKRVRALVCVRLGVELLMLWMFCRTGCGLSGRLASFVAWSWRCWGGGRRRARRS